MDIEKTIIEDRNGKVLGRSEKKDAVIVAQEFVRVYQAMNNKGKPKEQRIKATGLLEVWDDDKWMFKVIVPNEEPSYFVMRNVNP